MRKYIYAVLLLTTLGLAVDEGVERAREARAAKIPPTVLPTVTANPAYTHETLQVEKGESLRGLFARAGMNREESARTQAILEQYRNLRAIPQGMEFTYTRRFADRALRGVFAQLDPDRTLTIRVSGGTWDAAIDTVPVVADTVAIAGTVKGSLYASLVSNSETGLPVRELEGIVDVIADQIFSRKIDFSKEIEPEARFTILYERLRRPDGSSRTAQVTAARLENRGKIYEGYQFGQASQFAEYYDAEGKSLKSGFLRAPLEFRRISSTFSKRRYHPILGRYRAHQGVDYAAATGTPVRAVGDGTIAMARFSGGFGNLVEIKHAGGYSSRYAHLSRFGKGIRKGRSVQQGDVIGYVGTTGLSTGPHLHYEFRLRGVPVNPANHKSIAGPALSGAKRQTFLALVKERSTLLDAAWEKTPEKAAGSD